MDKGLILKIAEGQKGCLGMMGSMGNMKSCAEAKLTRVSVMALPVGLNKYNSCTHFHYLWFSFGFWD